MEIFLPPALSYCSLYVLTNPLSTSTQSFISNEYRGKKNFRYDVTFLNFRANSLTWDFDNVNIAML